MGFLKRFIKSTSREEFANEGRSSFNQVTEVQLEEHLNIARYGSFLLTDAVRPSLTSMSCLVQAIAGTSIATRKPEQLFPSS